ncbi:hypothetical protein, partial [Leucobacter celer]|uniref:hypothetical protein n=1 Tax=Leucobacter celer TaxID=668625 RepID=UPI000ABC87F3
MTKRQRTSRAITGIGTAGRFSAAVLAAAGLLLGLSFGGAAQALPPDGPGPETPGTSSRVWPSEVAVGDLLYFEVSGYPANETVYIKIDDGMACSDTSHGACVYATQALDANGYATGSIVVPDLPQGAHWLRMLATGDVFDSQTGEKLGYEGYTRRGGNDFTVIPGGASGGGAGGTGGGAGAQTGGGAGTGGSDAGGAEGAPGGSGGLELGGGDEGVATSMGQGTRKNDEGGGGDETQPCEADAATAGDPRCTPTG